MRGLFLLILGVVVVAVLLRTAGVDLPFIDYPIGPIGEDLVRPEIEIQAPGFDDFEAP